MKMIAAILGGVVAIGLLVFHPGRPLYMQNRSVEVRVDSSVVLHGTLSLPRWSQKPVPAVAIVHGSGPLTRNDVRGDARQLVRLGFAVLSYDKRGAGTSSGVYIPGRLWGDSAETVLRQLAGDAAAVLDRLASESGVDTTRIGFFGASQAGWIIPLAATRARHAPRFNVILSGAAIATGVEGYYSDLTGDGQRAPRVTDRAEVERLVRNFNGNRGYDPAPTLLALQVPTLWLLGDLDESVPTFASVDVLNSIRAEGNTFHTVHRYPSANHSLRDVATGEPMPIFDEMMRWLKQPKVIAPH